MTMKKLLSSSFLLLAAVALAATAEPSNIPHGQTLVYKDFGDNVYFSKNGGLTSYHVRFDLSGDCESIEKARLSVYLKDDCGSIFDFFEYASIFLDGEEVVHHDEVDSWFDKDLTERYSFGNQQVLPHLDDLILDIEIKWDRPLLGIGKGDFYYKKSILRVTDSSAPIPGAVWLLASGFIGLACVRRKLAKA
jgi:hypothetical protein